jgi:hypothetical protein
MNPRNFLILILVAAFSVVAIIGAATAQTATSSRQKHRPPVTVSALQGSFHPTRRQKRELRRLRAQIRKSPSATIASTADVDEARPVALPDDLGDAWVSMGDDGAVCTFIPDPLGGYGSSCATQEDLRVGGSITVLGGAGQLSGEAVAVLVVPDGGQTPVVIEPDGTEESHPTDGIGAALVSEESSVAIGAVQVTIPNFTPRCQTTVIEGHQICRF